MTKELKILKTQLRGHYEEVANMTGKSISTVSLVLNGKYLNEEVINAAMKVRDRVVKEREAKISRIQKQLSR